MYVLWNIKWDFKQDYINFLLIFSHLIKYSNFGIYYLNALQEPAEDKWKFICYHRVKIHVPHNYE